MTEAAGTAYLDRPRLLAFGGVALGSAAAWIALAALHGPAPAGSTGWIDRLCGIAAGAPFRGAMAIWALMSVAMMLPTAAPAVDVYVRLSRRLEAQQAAHVAAFGGGYVAAWAALAALAGALQVSLGARAAGAMAPGLAAGSLLLLAGLYQLTPLKQACLTLCRNPLAFFMGHWREGIGGAFAMGLHHGAVCIGCCWALMGLMFLAGTMNLAWMAALGLAMLLEKAAPGAARAGRLAGLAMALGGAALIGSEFI